MNATTEQPQAEATDTPRTAEAILKDAIAALPAHTDLIYVDYRDHLTNEQIAKLLQGNEEDVTMAISEAFQESQDGGVDYALQQAVPDAEEREILTDDSAAMDTFRTTCYERDQSTPLEDLLRNTRRRMVRIYLRNRKGEGYTVETGWNASAKQLEREAKTIARKAKIDYETNKQALYDIVNNASYGGDLCILGYFDITDLYKCVDHCLRDPLNRVALTFENPHLLIHDGLNGSGYEDDVKGTITVRFGLKELQDGLLTLDHKDSGTGYSWSDDIAGVVYDAYKANPKRHLYKARPKKA